MAHTATPTPPQPPIFSLPNELLEAIVADLPPPATLAFGRTCRRSNKITFEPVVWRRHCTHTWRHWEPRHELEEKLRAPPAQTKWRLLFERRKDMDRDASELFELLLASQPCRYERMEKLASFGYDIKDLMLRIRNETPDDAEDVLARRYHANAVLGQIHRATAVEKWARLKNQQMVRLEEVLGAFDLFVLSGDMGDLNDLDKRLNELADAIRDGDPEWEDRSTRRKAIRVCEYLRSRRLLGNPNLEDYHALRNNFLTMALFDDEHTSLPLQSVAIYCAVARRLGIDAKPANYPQHVHAIIKPPQGLTLDGRPATNNDDGFVERMHLDPWRNSEEVPEEQLRQRLLQMAAPTAQIPDLLDVASTFDSVVRAGKNIMHSVQEARDRQRDFASTASPYPDVEHAWYSMLWAMIVLGDNNDAATLNRRRQCLPYLIEHFQAHFPEDVGLVRTYIPRMFEDEREHDIVLRIVDTAHAADRNRKAPHLRNNDQTAAVRYKIGHHFIHRRFRYRGMIIGWDVKCDANPEWIEQMGVDTLPGGRQQPFYNVVYDNPSAPPPPRARVYYLTVCVAADTSVSLARADDKSVRYVADENIQITTARPCETLMQMAGRYFKRWDDGEGRFVSNMQEAYPDD